MMDAAANRTVAKSGIYLDPTMGRSLISIEAASAVYKKAEAARGNKKLLKVRNRVAVLSCL